MNTSWHYKNLVIAFTAALIWKANNYPGGASVNEAHIADIENAFWKMADGIDWYTLEGLRAQAFEEAKAGLA